MRIKTDSKHRGTCKKNLFRPVKISADIRNSLPVYLKFKASCNYNFLWCNNRIKN